MKKLGILSLVLVIMLCGCRQTYYYTQKYKIVGKQQVLAEGKIYSGNTYSTGSNTYIISVQNNTWTENLYISKEQFDSLKIGEIVSYDGIELKKINEAEQLEK